MASRKKTPDFEQALGELEQLVEHLEEGDLSLEDAIKTYERGVTLGKTALKALDAAQQRVQILNEPNETGSTSNFEASDPE